MHPGEVDTSVDCVVGYLSFDPTEVKAQEINLSGPQFLYG